MTLDELATDFVARCASGDLDGAGRAHWAADVVSIEPPGMMPPSHGREAVEAKGAWWNAHHTVHGVKVEGPYVHGDQFVVRFTMDVTNKDTGERRRMDELGVYTVRDGKIAEERFFYGR